MCSPQTSPSFHGPQGFRPDTSLEWLSSLARRWQCSGAPLLHPATALVMGEKPRFKSEGFGGKLTYKHWKDGVFCGQKTETDEFNTTFRWPSIWPTLDALQMLANLLYPIQGCRRWHMVTSCYIHLVESHIFMEWFVANYNPYKDRSCKTK